MPGGEVLTLVDALAAAGIEMVLARHETAAGFMAEGAWHATGAPGVLLATLGPGAMNAAGAVANAHQDRVPLIVVTGCVDADEAATYTHQVLDHSRVFETIVKASFRLTPGTADVLADKAVGIATEGRPGPVHLDVPISVAAARAPPRSTRQAPARRARRTGGVRAGRGAALALAGAAAGDPRRARRGERGRRRRPATARGGDPSAGRDHLQGQGADPRGPSVELGRGRGSRPWPIGTSLPLFGRADLILLAGYDPIEMRAGWRSVWDPARVRVIDLAAEPGRHAMHQATMNVVGHVGATLDLLAEGQAPREVWSEGEPAAARAALAAALPNGRGVGGRAPWWTSAAGCFPTRPWPPPTRAPTGSCCRRCGARR